MIDAVRTTVMTILNKDNHGFITPDEFNAFAKQAQLELFEDYFYDYNQALVNRNNRRTNSGYADIPRQLAEVIDTFTFISGALANVANVFTLPTDWYTINTVLYQLATEVERVNQAEISKLVLSNLTTPNTTYPAYTMNGATASILGNKITLYPTTIGVGDITVNYVRYPVDPVWTYTMVGGNPIFNGTSASYVDFELPKSDQANLVMKILQYSGLTLRETDIVTVATANELNTDKKES
jgi:hypothetical protein